MVEGLGLSGFCAQVTVCSVAPLEEQQCICFIPPIREGKRSGVGEQAIKLFILNDNCHEPGVRQFASNVSNLPAAP